MKKKNTASEMLRTGGRRGGLAQVPKGLAKQTPERRREIALAGVAARQKKREKKVPYGKKKEKSK